MADDGMEPQYAERDAKALDMAGQYYYRHVCAMTYEGLHSKADIAAELGYRDLQIDQLRADMAAERDKRERAEAACADKDNALLTAARQFRWYEEMHRAKPDHEKADRNAEMASRCERSLSTDAGRAYAERMERYWEALERIADECERHAIKGIGNIARGVLDKETEHDHAQ